MQDEDYFAEWLTRTLAERGISGGEVARALEVNDSAVSRWRNGKATPGLSSVLALAAFLNVPPVALTVTAGLMEESQAKVARLPLPNDTKSRTMVKDQIMSIRGLTTKERGALVQAYDEVAESAGRS